MLRGSRSTGTPAMGRLLLFTEHVAYWSSPMQTTGQIECKCLFIGNASGCSSGMQFSSLPTEHLDSPRRPCSRISLRKFRSVGVRYSLKTGSSDREDTVVINASNRMPVKASFTQRLPDGKAAASFKNARTPSPLTPGLRDARIRR